MPYSHLFCIFSTQFSKQDLSRGMYNVVFQYVTYTRFKELSCGMYVAFNMSRCIMSHCIVSRCIMSRCIMSRCNMSHFNMSHCSDNMRLNLLFKNWYTNLMSCHFSLTEIIGKHREINSHRLALHVKLCYKRSLIGHNNGD